MASIDAINFDWDNHSRCNYDGRNLRISVTNPLEFATAMVYLEKDHEEMSQNPVYEALREAFFKKLGEESGHVASSYTLFLPEKNGYVKGFLEALKQT